MLIGFFYDEAVSKVRFFVISTVVEKSMALGISNVDSSVEIGMTELLTFEAHHFIIPKQITTINFELTLHKFFENATAYGNT